MFFSGSGGDSGYIETVALSRNDVVSGACYARKAIRLAQHAAQTQKCKDKGFLEIYDIFSRFYEFDVGVCFCAFEHINIVCAASGYKHSAGRAEIARNLVCRMFSKCSYHILEFIRAGIYPAA